MRKIEVEIECGKETCDHCRFLEVSGNIIKYGRCINLNKTVVPYYPGSSNFKRLPKCFAAEVEEEKAPCSN